MEKILRLPEVKAATGKSRSSIYQGMEAGTFPRPVALGARAIGWRASSIESYIQSLRGKDVRPDSILEALRNHPEGMTRTGVNNHFGRNKSKAALDAAIAIAQRNGSLRIERRETAGRAVEVLQLVSL
jgi:prophage regulatory protein